MAHGFLCVEDTTNLLHHHTVAAAAAAATVASGQLMIAVKIGTRKRLDSTLMCVEF